MKRHAVLTPQWGAVRWAKLDMSLEASVADSKETPAVVLFRLQLFDTHREEMSSDRTRAWHTLCPWTSGERMKADLKSRLKCSMRVQARS
jgi:hypothetical protein